ncbi:MAG: TRAP transporter small permease [Pseudomonadota bacterium]
MRLLQRGLAWAARGCFLLAATALAAIVASISLEVALRYFANAPTHWVADSVGYLLAGVVMLALPEVTRARGHVAITLLSKSWEGRWPERLFSLLAGLVCLAAAWIIGQELARQIERGVMTQGAAPIPKAWITATVVLGLGLSGLVFLVCRQDDQR